MRYKLYFYFSNLLGQIICVSDPAVTKVLVGLELKMVANQFRLNPFIVVLDIILIITLSMGILVQSMSISESRSGRFCSWPTPRLCSISWITTP